ncbi:MAG: type II toxin-antitoxin system RelE/ParE family toxin [Nitrospirae bacterium]|nr:MAG: type II toxin-antitoxin system RelE/ParE family toxin [Nitrospirota bacterium]
MTKPNPQKKRQFLLNRQLRRLKGPAGEIQVTYLTACTEGIIQDYRQEIKEKIFSLAHNPRPKGCMKLVNRDGWRIRVGNYRVIYEVDDTEATVTIIHIGHRKDIYQK